MYSPVNIPIDDCSSATDNNSIVNTNTHYSDKDDVKIEVPCMADLDEALSGEEDCGLPDSYTPFNTIKEFIDFEEAIDILIKYERQPTLQDNIQEFESVLNTFPTTSASTVEQDISYNGISDIFSTFPTSSNNMVEKDLSFNTLNMESVDLSSQDMQISDENIDIIKNDNSEANSVNSIDMAHESLQETEAYIEIDIPKQVIYENLQENNVLSLETNGSNFKDRSIVDVINIVSVSSNALNDQSLNDDDDGYNSSDFEFITESEAEIEGYIINFRKNNRSKAKAGKNNVLEAYSKNVVGNTYQLNSDDSNSQPENFSGYVSDPGEGPSGLNISNRDYRREHVIPEGDGYLELFQGPFNPVMPLSDIIILENKAIRPSAMNVQYEGIGFDRQMLQRRNQPDSSEEEYADEAQESIRKIICMYPGENRRQRRRRF